MELQLRRTTHDHRQAFPEKKWPLLVTMAVTAILGLTKLLHYACPLTVKHWNPETGIGMLKIARTHFRLLWAAVTFIVDVSGHNAVIRVIHVGGSMRLCYKSAAEFGLGELEAVLAPLNS